MLRQVGRPFEAEGIDYETGDIVDVTGWPRVQRLQTLRYLLPAPKDATKPSKARRSSGGDAPVTTSPAAPSAPAAPEPTAPKAEAAPRKPAAKKAPAKKAPAKKAAPRKPAAKKAAPTK